MKQTISAILIICMLLVLASCDRGEAPQEDLAQEIPTVQLAPEQPIAMPPRESASEGAEQQETKKNSHSKVASESENWKIAIVTSTVDMGHGDFELALAIKSELGEDKVVHRTWPVYFAIEPETMTTILEEIAADLEVRALIISRAVYNTNAAVKRFREIRGDVFIIYAESFEEPQDSVIFADLVLGGDPSGFAYAAVGTAYEMGATTFVHYSFPRHMTMPENIARRDAMRKESQRLGIEFVEVSAYDPVEVGNSAAQQFIYDDLPNRVSRYGVDTAFFGTACFMQAALIRRVLDTGAIYAMPCHPSPFDGFPQALDIWNMVDSPLRFRTDSEMVEAIRVELSERDMSGRLASLPVTFDTLSTIVAVEYAVKWINGEVAKESVDMNVLQELIEQELGLPVTLTLREENSEILDNFVLINVDELLIF